MNWIGHRAPHAAAGARWALRVLERALVLVRAMPVPELEPISVPAAVDAGVLIWSAHR